jgi:hypothetical protein
VNLAKGTWTKGGLGAEVGDVVPFGRASDVKEYLAEMRARVCEQYHEHAEVTKMVGGREEGWFFDPPLR